MSGGPWWAFWMLTVGLALALLGVYALVLRYRLPRGASNAARVQCFRCGATLKGEGGDSTIILSMCQVMEEHLLTCSRTTTVITQGGGVPTISGGIPTQAGNNDGGEGSVITGGPS